MAGNVATSLDNQQACADTSGSVMRGMTLSEHRPLQKRLKQRAGGRGDHHLYPPLSVRTRRAPNFHLGACATKIFQPRQVTSKRIITSLRHIRQRMAILLIIIWSRLRGGTSPDNLPPGDCASSTAQRAPLCNGDCWASWRDMMRACE